MELQEAFEAGFEAVKQYIDRTFAENDAKLAAFEARIVRAEAAQAGVRYAGTWKPDKLFYRGELVTWQRGLWHANHLSTLEAPGASDAWTLIVTGSK